MTAHTTFEYSSAKTNADQNERDYEAFLEEIRSGRLEAAPESS